MIERSVALALGLALLVAGCAHYKENAPLAAYDAEGGYRFASDPGPGNSDEVFVVLTFSGGGTRAAALAYGVMQGLRDARITVQGRQTTLLHEADVVSSVSGGSFTAAYYALNRDRLFEDFETRFLKRDVQKGIARKAFRNPVNWFRLMSPYYDRIDLAAEYYDEILFDGHTFADLARAHRRPYLLVNATDLTLGAPFRFTQSTFDPLCSDLSSVPVARAVAASSAFPGLLSPVTVLNYARDGCDYEEPAWIAEALAERDVNLRRYQRAVWAHSYQDPAQRREFVHLLDGGVSDNLGLQAALDALTTNDLEWSLPNAINNGRVKRLVFVVVNAQTAPETRWDREEAAPDFVKYASQAWSASIDTVTLANLELLKGKRDEYQRDQRMVRDCNRVLGQRCPNARPLPEVPAVAFDIVEVSFDSVADAHLRACLKHLPTSFALPGNTVDLLTHMGRYLVTHSPDYTELMQEIGTGGPGNVAPEPPAALVRQVCGG